jgi:hypothetical protein
MLRGSLYELPSGFGHFQEREGECKEDGGQSQVSKRSTVLTWCLNNTKTDDITSETRNDIPNLLEIKQKVGSKRQVAVTTDVTRPQNDRSDRHLLTHA